VSGGEQPVGSPARVVAVVNPATRRDPARIVAILKELAPVGTVLEVYETAHQGHASDIVRQHATGADLVVAVGGDGTVGEVANAAYGSGIPLGIIPAGSTNIVARELGIPTDPVKAVRLLYGPHSLVRLDAGICGDRIFLHMAGAGVDSLMFDLTNPHMKRRVGWMAYVPAAGRALSRPLARYTITSPEVCLTNIRSPLVLVANGGSIIAPSIVLDRRIRFDDGLLDVLVVTATRADHLARVLARMATRSMGDSPFVTHFVTRELEISAEPAMSVQVDGDVLGPTPVSIRMQPAMVNVVVPAPAP
jgi:diacylglycerol kinase (ATP)